MQLGVTGSRRSKLQVAVVPKLVSSPQAAVPIHLLGVCDRLCVASRHCTTYAVITSLLDCEQAVGSSSSTRRRGHRHRSAAQRA